LILNPYGNFAANKRVTLTSRESEQRFVETISQWLVSLPHDLKLLYEAAENEDLEREARELAVGAIIYVVSPNDFIADRHDSFVSYCDDAILLRLAAKKIVEGDNEDAEFFKSRHPDFFETLDEECDVCAEAMGELFEWLAKKVDVLPKLEYKGKKVPAYLDNDEDGELLYEDGLGFRTEYPVDEETIGDKLKKASTVLEVMKRRKAEEARGT
jgi:uncharacterized membrane protein YkvA (DUF1232 family)